MVVQVTKEIRISDIKYPDITPKVFFKELMCLYVFTIFTTTTEYFYYEKRNIGRHNSCTTTSSMLKVDVKERKVFKTCSS